MGIAIFQPYLDSNLSLYELKKAQLTAYTDNTVNVWH